MKRKTLGIMTLILWTGSLLAAVQPYVFELEGGKIRRNDGFAKLTRVVVEEKGKKTMVLSVQAHQGQTFAALDYTFYPNFLDLSPYDSMDFTVSSTAPLHDVNLHLMVIQHDWKKSWQPALTTPWGFLKTTVMKPGVAYKVSIPVGTMAKHLDVSKILKLSWIFRPTADLPRDFQVTISDWQAKPRKSLAFSQDETSWKNFLAHYSPDYSDSSRYLEPPEDHRFTTPFPVVKDGIPLAEIVFVKGDEPECVATAAQELQRHVELITGAKLPIADAEWKQRKRFAYKIYLGKRVKDIAHTADSGPRTFREELSELSGTDGYAVRRKGHKLYVFGSCGKGTMNGVYRMLENNTDIIWARENDDLGTIYSTRKNLDFVWGHDVLDKPASRTRGWSGGKNEWRARNLCNRYSGRGGDAAWCFPEAVAWGNIYGGFGHRGGHNIGHLVPQKYYYKTHPEYYSLIAGKRTPWHQFCFMNQDARKIFIDNAMDWIRRAPDSSRELFIAMDDSFNHCECPLCTAPLRLADGSQLTIADPAFRSTQFFMLLNELAERMAVEFPGVKLRTLAYFSSAPPPKCPLHPSIRINYAPYIRANEKSPIFMPENREWLLYLQQWSKLVPDIGMYDYYGTTMDFPRPQAEVKQFDFPIFNRYVSGMSSEWMCGAASTEKIWDYSAMEFWVLTRMYWNPQVDVEKLRKYYLRRTFREAAPAMERFYGEIRRAFFKSSAPATIGARPVTMTKVYILDTGLEPTLRGYLEEAAKSVKHPKAQELVRRVSDCFEDYVAQAKAVKTPAINLPLIKLTEKLDFQSPAWKQAATIDQLVRIYRKAPVKPQNETMVKAFHDSDSLRFLFICRESRMEQVKCRQLVGGKEKIASGDHLEIFIMDGTQEGVYYLFTLSPFNQRAELKNYDFSWNGAWTSQVRRLSDRWECLVTIPLKTVNGWRKERFSLHGTFIRERYQEGTESFGWGGGMHHKTETFGEMLIQR